MINDNLNSLISKAELDKQLLIKKKFAKIIKLTEQFIINYKCLVYGGYAINEILPDDHKIYDENEFPDFDIYYPIPQIANVYRTYIQDHTGILPDKTIGANFRTIKIFIDAVPILDISPIDKDFYNKCVDIYNQLKSEKKLSTKFVINPFYLKYAFHQELGKYGSIYRWKKLFERLEIFNKYYIFPTFFPNSKIYIPDLLPLEKDIIDARDSVISYFKNLKNFPIIFNGNYIYLYYLYNHGFITKKQFKESYITSEIPIIDIIYGYKDDENMRLTGGFKNKNNVILQNLIKVLQKNKTLKISISHKMHNFFNKKFIANSTTIISINNILFCSLNFYKDECISYFNNTSLYNYSSIDVILRYFYYQYILNYNSFELFDIIQNIELIIKKFYTKNAPKRFSTKCIGFESDITEKKIAKLSLKIKKS